MPITVETRDPATGQLVSASGAVPPSAGDAPDAAAPGETGTPGAPASSPAGGEPPAESPPAPTPPGEGEAPGEPDDDAPEEGEPDAPVSIARFNRRVGQITRHRRAAERALAEERAERSRLQGQVELMTRLMQGETPNLGGAPPPSAPPERPKPEEYTDQAVYDRDMERWLDSRMDSRLTQQQQMAAMQQQLMDREATFKQAHPDFDAVVRAGLAGKVAPHVQQALMLLPDGPALAYALAQQQDLVQRLNTLPPPLVFAELGRLSSAPASTPPAQASTNGTASPAVPRPVLPPPMQPVSGQGAGPRIGWRDDMTQREYEDWRRQSRAQTP